MPNTQKSLVTHLEQELAALKQAGLYKDERVLTTAQNHNISTNKADNVINLCANNYLSFANHPKLVAAATQALDEYGYGMASVRFICGTNTLHKQLEKKLANFLGTEDVILYSSCFDANAGLFETLLSKEDAIISDQLNHASIIDGVRLCKAQRFRYANNDLQDLELQLQAAEKAGARFKLIATDGVFSMDGIIANLPGICALADKYNAYLMVDDSHAVGFMGATGAGTHEYHQVMDKVDILTGTLGKALGGASGGYVAGKKSVIDWLRQKSRPYLFSNSLAPSLVAASLAALDLLATDKTSYNNLWRNANYFRDKMQQAGFTLSGKDHAIIPVMIGDAALSALMAEKLLAQGIFVVSFSYPVVPKEQARIRVQMSADLSIADLDKAILAFESVAKELQIL